MSVGNRKIFFDALGQHLAPQSCAEGFSGSGQTYRRFRDPVIHAALDRLWPLLHFSPYWRKRNRRLILNFGGSWSMHPFGRGGLYMALTARAKQQSQSD